MIAEQVQRWRSENVQFFDATRVFDSEPAHVYMDDCCHYTQAGNYMLADFIAASILKVRRDRGEIDGRPVAAHWSA